MADDRRKRLSTMGQRFQNRGPGRPPSDHHRERQSIYIDAERWRAANLFCKDIITTLYSDTGLDAKKFDVHEEIFAFAAAHRGELIARLYKRLTESPEPADPADSTDPA